MGFFPMHSYSRIMHLINSSVTFAIPLPSPCQTLLLPQWNSIYFAVFLFSPYMRQKAHTAVCLSLVYFVKGHNPHACTIL